MKKEELIDGRQCVKGARQDQNVMLGMAQQQ